MNSYERLLAEKNRELLAAKTVLLQDQLENRSESERRYAQNEQRLVALEQALKDVQTAVSKPKVSFSLLENVDASVLWLGSLWFFTVLYNQLMKEGLPWLYVCFHIGTFYLIIRGIIQMYLMFRCRVVLEEVLRFNQSFVLLSGISSLVDVWASGRYNYHLSLSMTIFLSVIGSWNLYWGVMNAINVSSKQMKTLAKQMNASSESMSVLSAGLVPIWGQVKSCFNSTTILDRRVWPISNIDNPFYGRPDLLLHRLEPVMNFEWPASVLFVCLLASLILLMLLMMNGPSSPPT